MKKILILAFVLLTGITGCFAHDVIYNTKTKKVHNSTCRLANNCKNCVAIDINEAIERGAKSCSVCRSPIEDWIDVHFYKKKKIKERKEEEKRVEAATPGVKNGGNYTYTIK